MRIGFCGAAGTGKTTTLNALKKMEIENHIFIDEVVRTVIKEIGIQEPEKIGIKNKRQYLDFELQLLDEQIDQELKSKDFISDRTIIDIFAYMLFHLSNNYPVKIKLVKDRIDAYLNQFPYDFIIFFPSNNGLYLMDDGVRNTNKIYQYTMDRLMYGLLVDAVRKHKLSIIELHEVSLKDRVKQIARLTGINKQCLTH